MIELGVSIDRNCVNDKIKAINKTFLNALRKYSAAIAK